MLCVCWKPEDLNEFTLQIIQMDHPILLSGRQLQFVKSKKETFRAKQNCGFSIKQPRHQKMRKICWKKSMPVILVTHFAKMLYLARKNAQCKKNVSWRIFNILGVHRGYFKARYMYIVLTMSNLCVTQALFSEIQHICTETVILEKNICPHQVHPYHEKYASLQTKTRHFPPKLKKTDLFAHKIAGKKSFQHLM